MKNLKTEIIFELIKIILLKILKQNICFFHLNTKNYNLFYKENTVQNNN